LAKFYYGGQAVLEGVMMRGRKSMAVAVRAPDGQITLHEEPLTAAIYTKKWGQWPFVRGVGMLWDALGLGMRALLWSADVAMSEEEDVKFTGPVAWTTVASSLLVAVGLFFLLPTLAAKWLAPLAGGLAGSVIEGVIRLGLFLLYLWGIGFMPDIRRVFGYHGAEHKTINAYEAGAPLNPSSVARYSTSHTRCGTSFLLTVMVIAIIVFAPFHFNNVLLRLASRIVLIPVTADHARQLGCKVYPLAAYAYKFQDAVLVGAREGYYGECKFQFDLTTPQYLKMDRSLFRGLFGKFNPTRGDLVFSKTGELLGIMANSTYCVMIHNFKPYATIQFSEDVRSQPIGELLSQFFLWLSQLPLKLQ